MKFLSLVASVTIALEPIMVSSKTDSNQGSTDQKETLTGRGLNVDQWDGPWILVRDSSFKKFNPMQLYDERSIPPKTPKQAILKSKTTPNILSRIMEQVGQFREQPRSESLTSYDPAWFVMWLCNFHPFYNYEINKPCFLKSNKGCTDQECPMSDPWYPDWR